MANLACFMVFTAYVAKTLELISFSLKIAVDTFNYPF